MPKILVADDNTNIQKMVALALEERGISVVSVGNGEAAVRRIPDLDPDLVLADIFMPVRNGYEVCEFVKKDERFAHVPVILLVGAFDPLDEKEARRVGADGVLKKPFVPPDPLIAMVTSALEKNPRVAAELAKAKEVKLPPEPAPLPNIDLSSRPEPKPLPQFPEPSAEEAALVYGMGKGQRSLDSDNRTENGHSVPVAVPGTHGSDDDEADADSSADWRRSAMDFEIPADVASKPALAATDDLEPISFPSEKEYPPRRVVTPEIPAELGKVEAEEPASGSSSFSLRQVEDDEAPQDLPSSPVDFFEPALPEPGSQSNALNHVSAPPDASVPHDTEPQAQALPEPNSTAIGGHWLDAVNSSPASETTSDWMEALQSQPVQPAVTPEPELGENHAAVASPPAEAPEAAAEPDSVAPETFSAAQPFTFADQEPEQQAEPVSDQTFFAEESEHEIAAEPAPEMAPAENSAENAHGAAPPIELDADESEPPLSFQDPALVQPPAVHVKPEPLLVEDKASGPAQYGMAAEPTAPLHTFFAPAAEASMPDPAASASEPQPAVASEFLVNSAPAVSESSESEGGERIPTMPPPNREALSHIPFLTPPPSFLAELTSSAPQQQPHAADPETVDAVVQKVLEKLQPQLQELLSQGLLKPLVENILQSEVKKR